MQQIAVPLQRIINTGVRIMYRINCLNSLTEDVSVAISYDEVIIYFWKCRYAKYNAREGLD